jgi:phenylpropionate dioxygenase-like ring-hydroxylating dioxygenase large terminal subunit
MPTADLRQLLDRYRSGHSLEQPFYTDATVYEAEWKSIWGKYWLFAGTVAQIPKPGDYFTYQLRNNNIVIIRGKNGEVHAHHNSCRHRGSLICLEEKGHAPKLVCPYHQWVFEPDGTLFKARLMPDDFDKSTHGLHPVKVQVAGGLIFISLAQNPPDFEVLRKDYDRFLGPFQLHRAKVAHQVRYDLRTNWKLVAENFRECYHCGPAHPEYCSAVIGANMRESVEEVLAERQVAWREKGLAVETVDFQGDSFHFGVRYPLRPGVKSYSLDGEAIALPMGQHRDYDAGVLGLVTLPNFWCDAVSDYAWTMRLTALAPNRTVLDLTWLVDGDAVEGRDYSLDRLIEFWKITGEQDWALCENNFKGVESSSYVPGPYAPVEADVAKFVDWVVGRLKESIA